MNIMNEFKNYIDQNLPTSNSFHPYYEKAIGYILKAGGKHFRASLILQSVEALKPELTKNAMKIALGVEMMHTYSLIHDDLPTMDNADLRRGVKTLHVKYDEVGALLVGDALNTHAFYEISNANFSNDIKIKCIQALSYNAGLNGMVLGQAIDCYFENKKLNLQQLKFLHIHKTAKLIAASFKIGAIICECEDKMCDKIYNIGLDLGLAFQIQDDIIDATCSQDEAGKPVNNDSCKNSFTNLLGIDGAMQSKNELIQKIKIELKTLPNNLEKIVINLIDKHLKG